MTTAVDLQFTPEELRATLTEYRDRFVLPLARDLAKKLKAERKAARDAGGAMP